MQRLGNSKVARFATADAQGRPHIVPIVFALDGNTLYFAVDAKPKKTTDLKRLKNIAANPAVSVLVDQYANDWTKLWWVRADGTASVVIGSAEAERAIALLAHKYEQHRRERPAGPVVEVHLDRVTGWSATLDTVRRLV